MDTPNPHIGSILVFQTTALVIMTMAGFCGNGDRPPRSHQSPDDYDRIWGPGAMYSLHFVWKYTGALAIITFCLLFFWR